MAHCGRYIFDVIDIDLARKYQEELNEKFVGATLIVEQAGNPYDIYEDPRMDIAPGTIAMGLSANPFGYLNCSVFDEVTNEHIFVQLHPHIDKFRLVTEEELREYKKKLFQLRNKLSAGDLIFNEDTGEILRLVSKSKKGTWKVAVFHIPSEKDFRKTLCYLIEECKIMQKGGTQRRYMRHCLRDLFPLEKKNVRTYSESCLYDMIDERRNIFISKKDSEKDNGSPFKALSDYLE